MTIPYPQAKRLCTATEFQLLEAARTEKLSSFKAPVLKTKIVRTRGFLSKWRDLGRQQARQAKTGKTPERTAQKTIWFTEALRRFEAQLGKLEKAAEAAARQAAQKVKKAAKPKRKVPKSPQPNPMKAFHAVETRAKVRQMRIAQSGQKGRKHGHILASGRRNQAKRNAR